VGFEFIKYTQPGWQFNILPKAEGAFPSCHVNAEQVPDGFADKRYEREAAKLYDAAYRLWNKGYLLEADSLAIEKTASYAKALTKR